MITELDYDCDAGELLYHYCSPQTFLAIIQGKKLRFSDVLAMNDFSESRWGAELLGRCLNEHGSSWARRLAAVLSSDYELAHHLSITAACCFSRRGDVLSQWRAYADDATGFAIGFDPKQLKMMDARLLGVVYKQEDQTSIVRQVLKDIEGEAHRRGVDIEETSERVVDILLDAVGFKNPCFSEEDEVRSIHRIGLNHMDGGRVQPIYPNGGGARSAEVMFRMRGSTPVAYVDLALPCEDPGVRQIVVGPKAQLDLRAMKIFLGTLGYERVQIVESSVTYR
ncbi:TPA: DUF2971 domain-containing protein [Stenotrophomonas maltophilia]|nr:DUF2971 domain-containing protein [Stenotrophomonas maltophilia]